LRHADSALRLAREHDAQGLVANAMFDLALAHLASRENAQAEQLIRDAIEVNRRNANPQFEADSRVMMAILQEQTRPPAAREEYQNALNIYQRIGDKHGIATVYSNLVRTLWLMGDRDAVEKSLQGLLEINSEIGDTRSEPWTQSMLTRLKIDAGADDDAVATAQHALEVSKRAGTPMDQVIALRNLADVMRLRGRLDNARAFCRQARDAADQAGSPPGLIFAGYSCALVALDSGDVDAAIGGFEQSGRRAKEAGDVESGVMAAYQLARIDAARGRWSQARDRLRDAIEKLQTLDAAYHETGAQALLALCYAALDMPAERDAAAKRARELRSRVTFHQDLFAADVALVYLDNAGAADVASRLLALAAEAQKKLWVPEAFEARLAALQTLRKAHAPQANALQREIESAAQAGGFVWVAVRASTTNSELSTH
jgi:tetratricopeptide (TPR) repeat protein